jgi:NodT family efflux transporter outer membrane factor (OMF) lipoprotein
LRIFIFTSCLSLCLTSCTVGPDFEPPCAPQTQSYTESDLPEKTVASKGAGGDEQVFLRGKDVPACWWYLFHSKSLNRLIEIALKNSPTLQAAQAALRQGEANLRIALSALYPSFTFQAYPERQRFSGAIFGISTPTGPSVFNLYYTSVNASYTLDVFGGIRRQIEASEAQLDYQQFEVEATYLTLTSNIVTTAITEASIRGQIQATEELISAQAEILAITKKKFILGGASKLDILAQETQLAQTEASLPPLQNALAKTRHALSVLVGELPSESCLPSFNLNDLHLPTELPVSLPSSFVCQRPDIRAAEALLHAASAQIGVATANFFPQITLSGNVGFISDVLKTLFEHKSLIWSEVANLTQPIFRGGAVIAQRDSAIAAFEQAFAQYRQTVLQAFQNVADILRALEIDARQLQIQTLAEEAASNTLTLTRIQYKLGAVSYLNLLDADRQYHQARIGRIQAQAARYADTAALFQALGGGWWNRDAPCKIRGKNE